MAHLVFPPRCRNISIVRLRSGGGCWPVAVGVGGQLALARDWECVGLTSSSTAEFGRGLRGTRMGDGWSAWRLEVATCYLLVQYSSGDLVEVNCQSDRNKK